MEDIIDKIMTVLFSGLIINNLLQTFRLKGRRVSPVTDLREGEPGPNCSLFQDPSVRCERPEQSRPRPR